MISLAHELFMKEHNLKAVLYLSVEMVTCVHLYVFCFIEHAQLVQCK